MIEPAVAQGFLEVMKLLNDEIISVTGIKDLYQQKWDDKMSCYHREKEMEELRRCGCNQCREKYYHMERDYYRDHQRRSYYDNPLSPPQYVTAGLITSTPKETKVEPKIEEPKNYAVKLLVDQLKAQQANLNSKKVAIDQDKAMVKMYQTQLKNKNTEKLGFENKIKELSVALKKLGHKE